MADEENLDVGWFAPDELPPLRESSVLRLKRAASFDGRTPFVGPSGSSGPVKQWYVNGCTVCLRRAERADVPAIVTLLADDPLGAAREDGATTRHTCGPLTGSLRIRIRCWSSSTTGR